MGTGNLIKARTPALHHTTTSSSHHSHHHNKDHQGQRLLFPRQARFHLESGSMVMTMARWVQGR